MRLNIFGKIYKVKKTKLHEGIAGLCNNNDRIIYIDQLKCNHHTSFEQVLIHEMLHAVFFRIGITQSIDSQAEEIIVDSIATALVENFSFVLLENAKEAHKA